MAAPERQLGEDDRAWLVKTGERILGPFTCAELKERLRKRELVAIDEVATPGRRWRFVRDEPRLAKVLEDLRKAQLNRIDDDSTGSASRTLTAVDDLAEPTAVGFDATKIADDEARPSVTGDAGVGARVDAATSSPWRLRGDDPPAASRSSAARPDAESSPEPAPQSPRSFGAVEDARVRRSVRRSVNAVWTLTGVLVLAAAGALFFQRARQPTEEGHGSVGGRAAAVAGLKAFRYGRFEDALRLLSDAEASNASDPEVILAYASLLARAEQTQLAKRKADLFIEDPNAAVRARALSVRAAASIVEGDFPSGAFDLESALKAAPGDVVALVNLGVISYRRRDSADAVARFRDAAASPRGDAAPKLLLARALFATGSRASAAEAIELLRTLSDQTWDFKQEAHLLLAERYLAAGDRAQARLQALAAASVDPFSSESHWHDPAMAVGPLNWARELLPICLALAKEGKEPAFRALQAICEQKSGHVSAAAAAAADMIRRSPNDALAHAASAYVSLAQNDDASAEAALRVAFERASDETVLSLARSLRGRICWKRQDLECAREALEKLASQAPPSPFALVVLAHEEMRRSEHAKARELLSRARKISRNFIPALELEAELPK